MLMETLNLDNMIWVFQDKESVGNLVKLIDKSNGYILSSIDSIAIEFSKIAAGPLNWDYYRYPFSRSSCK
jgi:hypothetical protein